LRSFVGDASGDGHAEHHSARPEKNIAIHVGFKKQFASPPVALISPTENQFEQGKWFVAAGANNATATGFDVVFESLTGAAASGTTSFTCVAMGE
jgi:hypothetical protein